jgi:hypothetical protein
VLPYCFGCTLDGGHRLAGPQLAAPDADARFFREAVHDDLYIPVNGSQLDDVIANRFKIFSRAAQALKGRVDVTIAFAEPGLLHVAEQSLDHLDEHAMQHV